MNKPFTPKLYAQLLLSVSQVLFPLITYPVITRAIGANGLGLVAFVDAICQLLVLAAGLGIPVYGAREVARQMKQVPQQAQTFRRLFSIQALLLLPALAGLWALGFYQNVPITLLLIASINVVGSCLSCEWFLQGTEQFEAIALRTVSLRIITALLIYFFIHSRQDVTLYYALLVGNVLLTAVFNYLWVKKYLGRSVLPSSTSTPFRPPLLLFGCAVLVAVYTVLDIALLKTLSVNEQAGYYALGYRLVRLSGLFVISLGTVFIPRISFFYAANQEENFATQIALSQQLVFFFGVPLCFFFFVLAPELVAVLAAGKEFYPAIRVIRLLSAIPLLIGFSHFTGFQMLVPLGKEKILFLFLLAGSVLSVTLNILLIPHFAAQGTACSNLATELFIAGGMLLYLQQKRLLQTDIVYFFKTASLSALLIPIVHFLRMTLLTPLAIIMIGLSLFGLFYFGVMFWLLRDRVAFLFFNRRGPVQ